MTTPVRCALAALIGLLAAGPVVRAAVWRHAVCDPPRVACPACGYRGRLLPSGPFTGHCPSCRTPAGPAPMVPELLAAAAYATVVSMRGSAVETAALGWFATAGAALALVNAATHRLPDRLTAPAFTGTALLLTAAAFDDGRTGAAARLWLSALLIGAGYLTLALFAGVGLGDAKLAPTIGAALGYFSWSALVRGTLAAFLLGALFALARTAIRRAHRTRDLPLGPFMLLGAAAALVTVHG